MKSVAGILAILTLFAHLCSARVLRVPDEYATIQAAFGELATHDTVLVDSGLYAEDLVAPDFSFTLIGNIGADTTGTLRPVIDPSGLGNPTFRTCLTLSGGHVQIENFDFRNGSTMHPHFANDVGGIVLGGSNLTISDCRFDSVYYGIIGYPQDGNHTVEISHCDFRDSFGKCIFAQTIRADSCSFHFASNDWSQLTFGSNSVIEACDFSGSIAGGNVILGEGRIMQVSNCRFTDFDLAPANATVILQGGGIVVRDNTFTDFPIGSSVLLVSTDAWGPPCTIERNHFENLFTPDSHPELSGRCLSVACDEENGPCAPITISNNVFRYCRSTRGPVGISIGAVADVRFNTFEHLNENMGLAVSVSDSETTLRENIFRNNGIALSCDGIPFQFNAEWNYWGDESGPFHPMQNPSGQGDAVGDSVDFDPWYVDTLFWLDADECLPLLPESWSVDRIYPNPFNGEFEIEISGEPTGEFSVRLFDLLGRQVALLHEGVARSSVLHVTAPRQLASGVYFVSARDAHHSVLQRVVLLK